MTIRDHLGWDARLRLAAELAMNPGRGPMFRGNAAGQGDIIPVDSIMEMACYDMLTPRMRRQIAFHELKVGVSQIVLEMMKRNVSADGVEQILVQHMSTLPEPVSPSVDEYVENRPTRLAKHKPVDLNPWRHK